MRDRLRESSVRVWIGRDVDVAGATHRRFQETGIIALAGTEAKARTAGVVDGLHGIPASEIWLEVNERRLAEALHAVECAGPEPLHEQCEVLVIRAHEPGRVQIGNVLLVLIAAAAAAAALKQFVVREHRGVPMLSRFDGLVRSKRSVGVPRFPTSAGVDAADQVLVAVVPVRPALRHPGVTLSRCQTKGEV